MSSTVASSVRPGLRESRQPSSPRTPSRFISSTFSSPGSTFRQEEDAIIIELGSRYLRAGFEGEAAPQCNISFSPTRSRRVGDYRDCAPEQKCKSEVIEAWGKYHELWRTDLKDFDLGLFEDKLERAIREVYNTFLLTDAGSARLVLVLPSILPHQLLDSLLTSMFKRWRYPTITLLPAPTMAALAAGLRSALIVDIGWHETTATTVCEYREIHSKRTTRAMKALTQRMGRHLKKLSEAGQFEFDENTTVDFGITEEIVSRLAWCGQALSRGTTDISSNVSGLKSLSIAEDDKTSTQPLQEDIVEIEWPLGTSSKLIKLPLSTFREPTEATFFASNGEVNNLDDDEWTIPVLVYKTLLSLPPDVRSLCMSRIVFVGGGAKIPGLSATVISEVDRIVQDYGWNAVRGNPVEKRRKTLKELNQGRASSPPTEDVSSESAGKDYVEEKLQKRADKEAPPPQVQGVLRQVESLGSWVGASLLATLKIKGYVEVEREKYLSHGLSGAHRDLDKSNPSQRSVAGSGGLRTAGDRSSWTLAGWA